MPHAATQFRLGYRPELDGLRGLAILVVMLYHLRNFPLANGGHIGVDVFFVLSGFLITSLLLAEWEKNAHIDLTAFYARRALRLLPALYTMVVCATVFALIFRGTTTTADDSLDLAGLPAGALGAITYTANWLLALQISYLGPFIHTWTLAMEEQFYIAWPVLLLLLLRMRVSLQAIAIGLSVGIVGVGIWRFVLWQEFDAFRAQYAPDARADALMLGCLVAILAHNGSLANMLRRLGRSVPLICLITLVVIGSIVPVRSPAIFLGVGSLTGICAAICLGQLVAAPRTVFHSVLILPGLANVGRISYGLYIWHLPVYFLIDGTSAEGWLIEVLISFAIAIASFLLVERPALQLKSRYSTGTHFRDEVQPSKQQAPLFTESGAPFPRDG